MDYDERVAMDVWTVHNGSLWLDVIIAIRTVKTVLKMEGIRGATETPGVDALHFRYGIQAGVRPTAWPSAPNSARRLACP